ncbi:MAG: RNase adapter RapZ [Micavibrio sp.]|nr:RNase adapter RapZ [Micavibrio sp.]
MAKKPPVKKTARKVPQRKVLLVTGLSGAGLSTALKALEDLGYQAVDNLPLALVDALLARTEGRGKPVAIGIDSRTWDFSGPKILKKIAALKVQRNLDAALVFVNCDDQILQQRYTETRRVHPLAIDRPIADGVQRERQMMQPIRKAADHVIDTSDIKAHDLRRLVAGLFHLDDDRGLFVAVTSFGFRNGVPREADLVFDVRFLDNPHWDPKLRPLSGLDAPVVKKIESDPEFTPFFKNVTGLLAHLLPRYDREGKHYLTVAVGCTGGRHRSVYTAEKIYVWLNRMNISAGVRHRDLDKWAAQQQLKMVPEDRHIKNTKRRSA